MGFNPFDDKSLLFNLFYTNFATIGVYLLIFVSGAVLEYNYDEILSMNNYLSFELKRLLRLYPAFWCSMIFGLILVPTLVFNNHLTVIMLQFTGFTAFGGYWGGNINAVSWFIGLIVVLYILFPFLSKIMKIHPYALMVGVIILDFGSRYILNTHHFYLSLSSTYSTNIFTGMDRWLPLCNLAEFCFGIFIVQKGFYPKRINNSNLIRFLSDLSFYVFLMHHMILKLSEISLFFYAISVLLLSVMLYSLDERMQVAIRNMVPLRKIYSKDIIK